jgi:hypothetical protein
MAAARSSRPPPAPGSDREPGHLVKWVGKSAAALAAGGIAAAWIAWAFARPQRETGQPAQPLTATGYVDPGRLAPGRSVPVTAEIFNPNYFPVSLSAPRATDVVPDGSCRAGDVVFTARPRLTASLDPWTAQTVPVGTLAMKDTAAPACRHAGFHLDLTFATRAHAN